MPRKMTAQETRRTLALLEFLDDFRTSGGESVSFYALYSENPDTDETWTLGAEIAHLQAELRHPVTGLRGMQSPR